MERITTSKVALLFPEAKDQEKTRSAVEEWARKAERHEEFAVRGSTNAARHNEEVSRRVRSWLRNFK